MVRAKTTFVWLLVLVMCLYPASPALASTDPVSEIEIQDAGEAGEASEEPVSEEPEPEKAADETPEETEPAAEKDPWLAALILRNIVGIPADGFDWQTADANGDSAVDVRDAAALLPEEGCPAGGPGCGPEQPDDPGLPELPDPPDPFEGDFYRWNGNRLIWLISPAGDTDRMEALGWSIRDYISGDGWTSEVRQADEGPDGERALLDQAAEAGVGAVILSPTDAEALKDAALAAQARGIAVIYLYAEPSYPVTGYTYQNYALSGQYAAEAAENWLTDAGASVPETEGGLFEAAVAVDYDNEADACISRGALEAVEKAALLTPAGELTADGAAAFLGEHPDCRVFLTYSQDAALALDSALAAYCETSGASLAGFCVIACGVRGEEENEAFFKAYADAKEDPARSAVRGYALCGDITEAHGCILYGPMQQKALRIVGSLMSAVGVSGYETPYGSALYDRVIYSNVLGFTNIPPRGGLRPPVILEDEPEENVLTNEAA